MRTNFNLERFGIKVRGFINRETREVGFYNDDGTDSFEYPPNPFYKETQPVDYRHFESIKDSFYIDLNYNGLADIIIELGDDTLSFGRVPASINRIYYIITVNPEEE